jgi:hypothetical protein
MRATSDNSSTTTGSAINALACADIFAKSFAINAHRLLACCLAFGESKSLIIVSFTSYTPDGIGLKRPHLHTIASKDSISYQASFNFFIIISLRNWNCSGIVLKSFNSSTECLMFSLKTSSLSLNTEILVEVDHGLITRIFRDSIINIINHKKRYNRKVIHIFHKYFIF